MGGHFFCKLLVPDALDKAGLASELERISGVFRLSARNCFFPGTHERMLILQACSHPGLFQLLKQLVYLFKEAQHLQGNPDGQLRIAVPNSSVSQLIGRGGRNNRNLRVATGCFTNVSPRVDVLQERLIMFIGSQESTLQAMSDVCTQVQGDPNLAQHMHFIYKADLPLGVWDSWRPVTAGSEHGLLSPEAAQQCTKRELIEYLRKVAPSEVLLRHSLLGSTSKAVKRKSTDSVHAAVLEVWKLMAEVPTPPSVSMATGIAEAQPDVFQFEAPLEEKSQVASGCKKKKRVIRLFPAEANTESPKAPPEEYVKVADASDFLQLAPGPAKVKTSEDNFFTNAWAGSPELLDLRRTMIPTLLPDGASNDSSLGEKSNIFDLREDETLSGCTTDDTDNSNLDELPPQDEPVVGGSYFCKVLVPACIAGAMIGKGGSAIAETQHSSGCQLLLSASTSVFPGTMERILVMGGHTEDSLKKCLELVLERMHELGRTRGPKMLVKMVTPNSAVSQLIGMGGCNTRLLSQKTGCRIHISPRCFGIQERLIYMSGDLDETIMAATSVCGQLQDDPHLQTHMHFTYNVVLPVGAWDTEAPGPAEPGHPLLSLEDARKCTKRELIEYLLKAAPRELLLQHRLLGRMRKSLKSKSTDTVLAAVEETWKLRVKAPGKAPRAETSLSHQEEALRCAAASKFVFEDNVPTSVRQKCLRYFPMSSEEAMSEEQPDIELSS